MVGSLDAVTGAPVRARAARVCNLHALSLLLCRRFAYTVKIMWASFIITVLLSDEVDNSETRTISYTGLCIAYISFRQRQFSLYTHERSLSRSLLNWSSIKMTCKKMNLCKTIKDEKLG